MKELNPLMREGFLNNGVHPVVELIYGSKQKMEHEIYERAKPSHEGRLSQQRGEPSRIEKGVSIVIQKNIL